MSNGLSVNELARRTGLSPQGIYYVESGKRRPQRATIQALAVGLNVSPEYLEHGYTRAPGEPLPVDLLHAYRVLDEPGRRALLQNARTLRELEESYSARNDEELPPERELAAHPDIPAERREAEAWETEYLDQEGEE